MSDWCTKVFAIGCSAVETRLHGIAHEISIERLQDILCLSGLKRYVCWVVEIVFSLSRANAEDTRILGGSQRKRRSTGMTVIRKVSAIHYRVLSHRCHRLISPEAVEPARCRQYAVVVGRCGIGLSATEHEGMHPIFSRYQHTRITSFDGRTIGVNSGE